SSVKKAWAWIPSSSFLDCVQKNAGFEPQIWMPPGYCDCLMSRFFGAGETLWSSAPQAPRTPTIGLPIPLTRSWKCFPQPAHGWRRCGWALNQSLSRCGQPQWVQGTKLIEKPNTELTV